MDTTLIILGIVVSIVYTIIMTIVYGIKIGNLKEKLGYLKVTQNSQDRNILGLAEKVWVLENPPKFSNGDTVYSKQDGTKYIVASGRLNGHACFYQYSDSSPRIIKYSLYWDYTIHSCKKNIVTNMSEYSLLKKD